MAFGGLDIGTSGCKCTLFSDQGKQLAMSYRAYETTRGQGQHEIDVFVVWEAVKVVLKEATAKAGEPPEAICVSSFGESCAFLDRMISLSFQRCCMTTRVETWRLSS